MKKTVLEIITNSTLEKILDVNDLDSMDWIWINKGVFQDILLNLGLDETFGEDQLEAFVNEIDDLAFISSLEKPFERSGYIVVNQFLFSMAESGFKPTRDIETIIFMKEKAYKKLIIKLNNEYGWMLKAMAIDTFFKMSTQYGSVNEAYTDLFEDNGRIVETLLSNEEYKYLTGCWSFNRKTKELLFLKHEEVYQSWGEGEAEARFGETNR